MQQRDTSRPWPPRPSAAGAGRDVLGIAGSGDPWSVGVGWLGLVWRQSWPAACLNIFWLPASDAVTLGRTLKWSCKRLRLGGDVPLLTPTLQALMLVAGEGSSLEARFHGWVSRPAGALSVAPSPAGLFAAASEHGVLSAQLTFSIVSCCSSLFTRNKGFMQQNAYGL